MKKVKTWLNESFYTNPLSPACKMCAEGSKLVLLVTGLCNAKCFYCPLSRKKFGNDVIYADEWKLDNEEDTDKIFKEAKYINAKGAGITGGDPLVVWKRTVKYIKILKENFGKKFHIHLYTSGVINTKYIPDIVSAGLDEIRFHPNPSNWNNMDKGPCRNVIINTVNLGLDTAIEIPSLPDKKDDIISLIKWADSVGVRWINLNELEFSETNAEKIIKKGYTVKDDVSAAVKNSQQTAIDIISNLDLGIGLHYCSSSFKDGTQLRNRIKRRAESIANEFDIITEEGTILKGIITSKDKKLEEIKKILIKDYKVDNKHIIVDKQRNRVQINLKIIEKISEDLKKRNIESFLVEEYPTADGLQVEKIPFPLQ